eukprot:Em0218g2a
MNEYVQDPRQNGICKPSTQPYPTAFTPQFYGGNLLFTPQQPAMLVQQQPTPVPISSAVRPTSGDNYPHSVCC